MATLLRLIETGVGQALCVLDRLFFVLERRSNADGDLKRLSSRHVTDGFRDRLAESVGNLLEFAEVTDWDQCKKLFPAVPAQQGIRA